MAEPRMRQRQKGQQFGNNELTGFLRAYGDDDLPLPPTLLCLDELLTDFIIETCHSAALCASYSRRQKIKVDDFKWVLRRDAHKLGKVVEIAFLDNLLREDRKVFDAGNEGVVARRGKGRRLGVEGEGEEGVGGVGEGGLEEGREKGEEGGGKRRRKKRRVEDK